MSGNERQTRSGFDLLDFRKIANAYFEARFVTTSRQGSTDFLEQQRQLAINGRRTYPYAPKTKSRPSVRVVPIRKSSLGNRPSRPLPIKTRHGSTRFTKFVKCQCIAARTAQIVPRNLLKLRRLHCTNVDAKSQNKRHFPQPGINNLRPRETQKCPKNSKKQPFCPKRPKICVRPHAHSRTGFFAISLLVGVIIYFAK